MKRILTSLSFFCLTFVVANAQNAQFYYHGQPLENDATVEIYAEEDEWGTVSCNTNPSSDPQNGLVLKNLKSTTTRCVATLTIEESTLNSRLTQWCMGGNCIRMTSNQLERDFTQTGGGTTQVQFDCEPLQEGRMEAQLTVLADLIPVSVKIHFIYDPAHINALRAHNTVVAFYTLDGRQVAEQPRGVSIARFADGTVRKVAKK